MNDKLLVAEIIKYLQQHKANLCCKEVINQLVKLGFEVKDGKRGGHKVFVHPGLSPAFHSASFNCGHGKNPEIKPPYIHKIIKILEQYSEELEEFLGDEADDRCNKLQHHDPKRCI